MIYALVLVREHLWEYLKHEAGVEKPVEIFGELEMLQLLEQFFDRASYYAAVGYEKALLDKNLGANQGRGAVTAGEIGHVVGH